MTQISLSFTAQYISSTIIESSVDLVDRVLSEALASLAPQEDVVTSSTQELCSSFPGRSHQEEESSEPCRLLQQLTR